MHAQSLQLCPTLCDPMDCNPQAPLSMRFFRQEYWSELPFPSLGNLSNPSIEPSSPVSPTLQVDSLTTRLPGKPLLKIRSLLLEQSFFSLFMGKRQLGLRMWLCSWIDLGFTFGSTTFSLCWKRWNVTTII